MSHIPTTINERVNVIICHRWPWYELLISFSCNLKTKISALLTPCEQISDAIWMGSSSHHTVYSSSHIAKCFFTIWLALCWPLAYFWSWPIRCLTPASPWRMVSSYCGTSWTVTDFGTSLSEYRGLVPRKAAYVMALLAFLTVISLSQFFKSVRVWQPYIILE